MDRLTDLARELRDHSTDAERLFWSKIRGRRLRGLKFKRQQPIGRYIVDFVCFEVRLIVELDGGQHLVDDRDKVRDAWLQAEGYRVLRFWNNDVLSNVDGVLVTMLSHLGHPLSNPLPSRERE